MNITRSTTSFTCPGCGQKSTYDLGPQELADGGKLVCSKCGREIPFDRRVFEAIMGDLSTSKLLNITTVTKSSMSFQCPRCGKTTTTDMTVRRLLDGERVFCSHCGNEIHADGDKLLEADAALKGMAVPAGGGEAETLDTSGGPVVVKTKSFNVNVKTNIDFGKTKDSEIDVTGTLARGAPIITPRRTIEPKSGCFGVMAVLAFFLTIVLVYSLVM
jgi:transcription elongation factor Elf1